MLHIWMNDQQKKIIIIMMICHKPWGVYKIIEIQTYMYQSSSTQLWEFSVPSTRRLLYNWVIDASRVYCFYFWLFYFDDNNNSNNGKCYTHTHIQVVFWALSEYVNLSGDCSLPSGVWVPRRAPGLPSGRELRLRQVWMLQGVCCTA